MATHTPPPSNPMYSYVSYPEEYTYSPQTYPRSPSAMPSMPHMDQLPSSPYSPRPQFAHPHYMAHRGHAAAPASPTMAHARLPASPVTHNSHLYQTPPTSPDRYSSSCSSSSSSSSSERAETKVLKQLCTAVTKMQGTMKEVAERQEQILDRMSLLEQRVGRMDDGIEKLLETTELALEDSRAIRMRVEDSESQEAFESPITALMNEVFKKLIGNISDEIKEIKRSVEETQRYVKFDPYAWSNRAVMFQRMNDAAVLGEEPQKEVHGM